MSVPLPPVLLAPLLGAALAFGWALGSLPLGALLAERWTGRSMRDHAAHHLGVENLLRLVGPVVALAAFGLDAFKGLLAAAAGAALGAAAGAGPTQVAAWAGLGAFLGHLYPWPPLRVVPLPRGRGNGVLLGVLAGLAGPGGVPLWAAGLPVAVYAGGLAATGWVAVGTVAGLLALALAALVVPGMGTVGALLLLAGVWRHKAALQRVADGTEPRLGDPPPVRGADPNVATAAFMIHPMDLDDLDQVPSQRWLLRLARSNRVPEALVRRALVHARPMKSGEIRGVRLPDGRELRVLLIGGPMLPEQIRARPEDAERVAIQGARLARELGAEAIGLGAYWSTVGRKGLAVQEAVPEIAVTNGGAYTAATVRAAVPGLLRRFEAEGGALRRATAAVVGANGVVAFGVARMVAGEVGRVILIGRDRARVERSAATLRRKHPTTRIDASVDVADVAEADLVFSATSDPDPVVLPEHVRPGAWIFDLGRPADVHPDVADVPGVHVIPGGVVRPPGGMRSSLDLRFGEGLVPACLAETMIMTATRAFDRRSLGPGTRSEDIEFYLREGERLGFAIATRDPRVAEPVEGVG